MGNKSMGEIIMSRRKALGLTQQSLANQLHVTNKAISKWETGSGLPDIHSINDLARVLDISIDELMSGQIHKRQKDIKIDKLRLVRLITRLCLLAFFNLHFVSTTKMPYGPNWLGLSLSDGFNVGQAISINVTGFDLMFKISFIGFMLIGIFAMNIVLLLMDYFKEYDDIKWTLPLKWMNISSILIIILFIGLCLAFALEIKIGAILVLIFSLSLGLNKLKTQIK